MKRTPNQELSPDSVAAAVVLYNSPHDRADNLRTYIRQVGRLHIIDNSPTPTPWVAADFLDDPAVVYHHFPENVGVATALNKAAQLALLDGFSYLLTMDDDSQAPADLVKSMLDYLSTVNAETIGLVAPRHVLTTAPNRISTTSDPTPVLTTMTSGNLLNLQAYERVGPFRDDLFIDVVDHEFDLRLQRAGYQIIELPYLPLIHGLGEQKRLPLVNYTYVSHSPLRNYYLVRNSLLVALQYRQYRPGYLFTALQTIGIETVKATLFEDERLLRLRLIGKAIADGLRNRAGKRLF